MMKTKTYGKTEIMKMSSYSYLRMWTNFLIKVILCCRSASRTSCCPLEASFAFERHFDASVKASRAFS